MDFRFTDEQRMIRESARSVLQRECAPPHVKEVERRPPFYDESLWRRSGELGWLELASDPASTLDTVLLCEELGRAAAPLPFLSSALAARALHRGDSATARDRWLGPLTTARAIGAVAITEPSGRLDQGFETTASRVDGGWRLDGEKAFVADGVLADVLMVAARHPDAGVALFSVDAAAEGIERRQMDCGPGLTLASIVMEGVRLGDGDVVGPAAALREVGMDAAVLSSALMLGHAAAATDTSVAYAKTREQFGVPIGTFQAVQHRLADMATEVETLRALVYAAAWKRARDEPDIELSAATVKAWAAEVLERCVTGAHQVHAGIGYTDDHDIQLHTRRAPWYASMFGTPREYYARAATLLGL